MEQKINILLAENDENLGNMLYESLNTNRYQTDLYPDGQKALIGFCSRKHNICLVDVTLPKKDGLTLAHEIHQINAKVPIIFLTSKSITEELNKEVSEGTSDFIIKPFGIEELQLRIEAILHRTRIYPQNNNNEVFIIGKYTFHYTKQVLSSDKMQINLTSKETELLHLLCLNMNEILDRNFALSIIWNDDSYFNARSMDVYITKLRKYLKDDPNIQIVNIRGRGFKLITS